METALKVLHASRQMDAVLPEAEMDTPDKTHAVLGCIDDIAEKPVEWLWRGRIPIGMLTIVAGHPGGGKSYVALDIAVRVCNGTPWPDAPDECPTPGTVIHLCGEDSVSRTVKPRLRGLGYKNNGRFYLLQGVKRQAGEGHLDDFWLESDLRHLEEKLAELGSVRLVIIDTLDCFLSGTDANKEKDVRRITGPLGRLAEEYQTAILCIRHLNKVSTAPALDRVLGSRSWAGAARSIIFVGSDPDNHELRYFIVEKLNLAQRPESLSFRIGNGYTLTWGTENPGITANEMLSQAPRLRTARDDAAQWLGAYLADGPVRASAVEHEASQKGFDESTLRRAKKQMRVESRRLKLDDDEKREWYWVQHGWIKEDGQPTRQY